jgi:hypothetical protein
MLHLTPTQLISYLSIFVYDIGLTLVNTVSSKRKEGQVTPEGHPGFGGKWPEFKAPEPGASRCSCPALNAMANHGILPRDGKNIKFTEMTEKINPTYNFSPSFCLFVPQYAANMLNKNYKTDTFDLAELDLHNGIEHDASLVRRDLYFEKDQSVIHVPYVEELLNSATGKDKDGNTILTIDDLAKISQRRRAESDAENPEYSLDKFHGTFGNSNSSTLLTIFGGRVDDLRTILLEERLPDNWESRVLAPKGLTFLTFNKTVSKVDAGIKNKHFAKAGESAAARAAAEGSAEGSEAPVLPAVST